MVEYTKEQQERIVAELTPLQTDYLHGVIRAADKIGVDRDELLEQAMDVLDIAVVAFTYKEYDTPPADVAPIKHAYNANEKYHAVDEFRCSECGIHIEDWTAFFEDEDDGEYTAEYEFRYCPNCGARMDGDKK